MADSTKKVEEKPIEDEGEDEPEDDNSQIQNNNFLEGDVSSPFDKAESAKSDEETIASKVAPEKIQTAEPSKAAPEKKQLDEEIIKQSSTAQQKVINACFGQKGLVKHMNRITDPNLYYLFLKSGVAQWHIYESISAMTRVTGLSKK